MGVDVNATVAQAYAIARLALWAGDRDVFWEMRQRLRSAPRTEDADEDFGVLAEHAIASLYGAIIRGPGLRNVIGLVETNHFRGAVSSRNRVVFELRAYLTNVRPRVGDAFSRHMQALMRRQPEGNHTGVRSWIQGENPAIEVSYTGLGQVRAVGNWGRRPEDTAVSLEFERFLRTLEFEA